MICCVSFPAAHGRHRHGRRGEQPPRLVLRREVKELAFPLRVVGPACVVPGEGREDLAVILHLGLGDRGRVPGGFFLAGVEAHLDARALRQWLEARPDDNRRRRRRWRRCVHERCEGDVVICLRLRLNESAPRWDAYERELHLVEWARVDAVDDALGVVLPEFVLASVGLEPDDVGVVGPLRADFRALRVQPVLEDRARRAEEDERGIGWLVRVPMDPRVPLVVRNLVVPDLHRVRARVQEEAFAPRSALEHRFRHSCQRVLRSLELGDAVVVASCCYDRLALVTGCNQRDEGGVKRPRRACIEDDDLRAVAEGRLVRVPDVEELEERGLVRRACKVVVHVVRDRINDHPLVCVRAADCLGANVPESVELERVADLGRPMEGGRFLRRWGTAQVGCNPDHVRVDEARRARRHRLKVEVRGSAGEAPEPSTCRGAGAIYMHLRRQEQVPVVRWHVHH